MNSLKSIFLLDPEVVYLNHGSFGACPRPVFTAYQDWQLRLERQPVQFFAEEVFDHLATARAALAGVLHCHADDVVFFPNPTTAANVVARSLDLQPGDEVLSTNHEYGAIIRTWQYLEERSGARFVMQSIPLPVTTRPAFVEAFWAGVTDRTRVIFIDHITSATALTLPVAEICRRAREQGILTIVDGAHAPGQIPVDINEIGADVYFGACHKWLCAPKGAAFLFARKEIQPMLEPLVVSWGYQPEPGFGTGNRFLDWHQWQGTRDLSAFLSVPAAIAFQADHDWDAVRARCHTLARETRARITALTGLPPICPDGEGWFAQFFSARLPEDVDERELKAKLLNVYRIEVPIFRWNDQPLIRVSFQGYNTPEDADALLAALKRELHLP